MLCKTCGSELIQYQHKFLIDKLIKQPFFYLRWYKCSNCGKRWQFEKDKIFNKTSEFAKVKTMRNLNLIK